MSRRTLSETETFDHIEDATSANAEREGYTDDPLSSDQAIDEETSCNFIPIKPSGILNVNGTSVSAEDISNHILHTLQIDSDRQPSSFSEANTVSGDLLY